MAFIPFQDQPPSHIEKKANTQKPRKSSQSIRQNSTGANSPNIIAGDRSTITIGTNLSGVLFPTSGGRLPAFRLPIPKGALVLNCGGNIVYTSEPTFSAIRIENEDVVTVHRVGGGLGLNARAYSPDGRVVADIENNEFAVNPNNYFKIKRPDKSTLVVYNQFGEESLNVKFVALDYVIISGIFYKPSYGTLTITADMIRTQDGSILRGFVFGGMKEVAFTFVK